MSKNWVKIYDKSRGTYDGDNQIRFKTSMLNTVAQGQPNNNTNKKVIFKSYAPFTNCINRINKAQVDDAPNIDVVIPVFNLIEYSDNYSKIFGYLSQFC